MALTYNLEEDIRYQQGEMKGEEKGEIKGELKKATQVIINMLKPNFTTTQIMEVVQVSKEFVEEVAKKMKK